jgi:UDP-N-acetylmuramyl tripeptide synthase
VSGIRAIDAVAPPPADALFEDSRRLTGPGLYFAGTGAALETRTGSPVPAVVIDGWRRRVHLACHTLGWPDPGVDLVARVHASGVSLAFPAPVDQLYAATEVNEWAWLASLAEAGTPAFAGFHAPGHPAAHDECRALCTLSALAADERRPQLLDLIRAAQAHGLPLLIDEDALSIGQGVGGRSWPTDALPDPEDIHWPALHTVPVALVTGSNGKTTTVRLVAAIAAAHGWCTAHSCTDGLYVDGAMLEGGDYSGPSGARTLLRRPEVEAAVLETARGGLLRRGLAVHRAQAAVVTNVSPDHYGEYGIHDLDDLAQVKLAVARTIGADGLLVLNAEDPQLVARGPALGCPLAWFALDDAHPLLVAHRAAGGATSAPGGDGRLWLSWRGERHDLGPVAAMPITLGGSARHNIANIAAAALAAAQLGIAPTTTASVLARFGSAAGDNPGRLQHWRLADGTTVYLDYAHNPDGMRHLLEVACRERGNARMALVLGQAGNRGDAQIADLAASAAAFRPDRVLLKDIDGFLRGRGSGEVAGVLRAALVAHGVAAEAIVECLDEAQAARAALEWAAPGDLLVLPIHAPAARTRVVALIDGLVTSGWRAGTPLPPDPA